MLSLRTPSLIARRITAAVGGATASFSAVRLRPSTAVAVSFTQHRRWLHASAVARMNVTKGNFTTALEELRVLLPTASLVAIDEEMTGIHLPGSSERMEKMDDTTAQRYAKMRLVAQHYRIIQIGLCLFHEVKDAATGAPCTPPRFEARPYNFYLFPESGFVNMEAEAVAFNRQHGMDWNMWIREGIPYVDDEGHQKLKDKFYGGEEGWIKEQVRAGERPPAPEAPQQDGASAAAAALPQEKEEKKAKRQITLDKEADIAYLSDVQSRVFAWLSKRGELGGGADAHELVLPEANSFLRLAVLQWFESAPAELFAEKGNGAIKANLGFESRSPPGQRWKVSFVLTHYSAEEKVALEQQALIKKRKDFDAKVGFKLVWDLLRQARAPLVVHNGFFDVLFMWSHFVSAVLPESLDEFKSDLGRAFPAGIFDTKFLSNSRQFLFPFEYLSRQLLQLEASDSAPVVSAQTRERLARFKAMQLPESSLTSTRFRETHLEKLYLRLKSEGEARIKTTANANGNGNGNAAAGGDVAMASSSSSSSAAPAAAPATVLPTVPLSEVEVILAPGFDKYALIGQPGGDDSAAHEAGYDAFMTAAIFASFAAEAPEEQFLTPLRNNRSAEVVAQDAPASARAMQASPWLNRIPLFRHLMALDLNTDPDTGAPRMDTLVDPSAAVFVLRGLPEAFRNEDVSKMFEEGRYTSAKRKMDDKSVAPSSSIAAAASPAAVAAAASASSGATPSTSDAMTDVVEPSSASGVEKSSSSTSLAQPVPVVVTAAPALTWIDGSSLFLSVPRADAAKMADFVRNYVLAPRRSNNGNNGGVVGETNGKKEEGAAAPAAAAVATIKAIVPPTVTIEPFAGVPDEIARSLIEETKQAFIAERKEEEEVAM